MVAPGGNEGSRVGTSGGAAKRSSICVHSKPLTANCTDDVMTGVLASCTLWSGSPVPVVNGSATTWICCVTRVALIPTQLKFAVTVEGTLPLAFGVSRIRIQASNRLVTVESFSV